MVKLIHLLISCIFLVSCQSRKHEQNAKQTADFARDGVPTDWGHIGPNQGSSQSVEAVLANEAAIRLNNAADILNLIDIADAHDGLSAVDGTVSVPVNFVTNDADGGNHPFGDGQKNATLGWKNWASDAASQVPFIATLIRLEGMNLEKASLIILEVSIAAVDGVSSADSIVKGEIQDDQGHSVAFEMKRDDVRDVFRAILPITGIGDGALSGKEGFPAFVTKSIPWLQVALDPFAWPRLRLRTWSKSGDPSGMFWPILFRFPAQGLDQGLKTMPIAHRELFGRPVTLPPYDITGGINQTPDQALQDWFIREGKPSGKVEFIPGVAGSGVHHQFRGEDGSVITTATGGVDTYVVKERVGSKEVLYTCFDARNKVGESQSKWGVPSGAGWHSIGHELQGQPKENWTFAETIGNGFESAGIFAGWGVRTPFPYAEAAPYAAKDIVTFRVLRSGELFTTGKGHFHWYAVDASRKVCTTIMKHLGCPLLSDKELSCEN